MATMAGLLTYVSARGDAAAHREAIAGALERVAHRGPDDTSLVTTADVAFGAHRLAVTDIDRGRQPLSYPPDGVTSGRYLIVLDGTVYNAEELRAELVEERGASFATHSDAEVIVAAYHHWGPSAVNRLRGMFAFVIWDGAARRAFGARDPYGMKPLYQLTTPGGVYFASEKKALLEFAPEAPLDPANLQHYLTLQYVPEPGTMHRGVVRLGSGESFVYTPGGPVANRRYSQLAFRPGPVDDEAALTERIRAALRDSVHAHLRADVPVGAFLSSGVDSTAIVALAREVEPRLPTFTVGYEDEGHSELAVAERVARELGVPHNAIMVRPDDVIRALPRIMWHLDDPVADPSLVPTWFLAEAAGRQVSVALSGDGADELFGGYAIYREPLSLATVSHLPDPMQRGLRAVSKVIPQGIKGKSFLERGTTPIEERYYGNARVFTEDDKARLLRHYDPSIRYTDVRPDVDGALGPAAHAVPRPGRVRRGRRAAERPEGPTQVDRDQGGAAPRPGRRRARRDRAPQARLPHPDPAVAAAGDVRLGARLARPLGRRRPRRPGGSARPAQGAPEEGRRPLPQDLDSADVLPVARDLRGRHDRAAAPGPGVPQAGVLVVSTVDATCTAQGEPHDRHAASPAGAPGRLGGLGSRCAPSRVDQGEVDLV